MPTIICNKCGQKFEVNQETIGKECECECGYKFIATAMRAPTVLHGVHSTILYNESIPSTFLSIVVRICGLLSFVAGVVVFIVSMLAKYGCSLAIGGVALVIVGVIIIAAGEALMFVSSMAHDMKAIKKFTTTPTQ